MEERVESTANILMGKLGNWYETGIEHLPNLIVALFVLFLFFGAAALMKRLTERFLKKTDANKAVSRLMKTLVFASVVAFGLFAALGVMNLDKTVTSLLAGAGVIGLALGFAFQEIAANFIAGIFIAFRQPYRIGDILKINDYLGKIEDINLRTTSLVTFDGLEVIIPNKTMFTEPITNYTTTPRRRVSLSVGVSYSDNLDHVETVVKKALDEMKHRISEDPVEVYFQEFGSSSINFEVRFWVEYPAEQEFLKARHEAVKRIKKAFDNEGITIPFPIRTLEVDGFSGFSVNQSLEKIKELQ